MANDFTLKQPHFRIILVAEEEDDLPRLLDYYTFLPEVWTHFIERSLG